MFLHILSVMVFIQVKAGFKFNKDITDGYVSNYNKVAQKYDLFECESENKTFNKL